MNEPECIWFIGFGAYKSYSSNTRERLKNICKSFTDKETTLEVFSVKYTLLCKIVSFHMEGLSLCKCR